MLYRTSRISVRLDFGATLARALSYAGSERLPEQQGNTSIKAMARVEVVFAGCSILRWNAPRRSAAVSSSLRPQMA